MLVAGALSGVYRSMDGGETWERISPLGSTEIHEIESIAIDPKDPAIIYAGTWHLPWKTTDGGDHWKNIKEGVIEDSDVFSIILDRKDPATVYASACSGIYKSGNGGELFKKVQGIPSTARRTRVLMQDPVHTDTVFAGTTEGLFRTADAGEDWLRVSAPDDIVNDVYIDPTKPDHLLVATDRGGVLMSDDGGFTYKTANKGFSARQVDAYAADPQTPARLFVGVVNDKDRGGVFVSENGGITWAQRADGLRGLDVFSLAVAPDHTVIAGTSHGIFSWSDPEWREYGAVEAPELPVQGPADPRLALTMTTSAAKHPVKAVEAKSTKVAGYNGPVYALLTAGNNVFAATEQGLLVSASSGASWRQVTGAGNETLRYVAAGGGKLLAADLRRMKVSADEGKSWKPVKMPASLTQLSGVAVDGAGELWAVGGEGIWFSPDDGLTWHSVPKLSLNDVNSIYFDATGSRMLVTANNASTFACGIHTPDKAVQCWDTGWHLRMLRPVGDHMVAATLFDGVVVQPRMVVSK